MSGTGSPEDGDTTVITELFKQRLSFYLHLLLQYPTKQRQVTTPKARRKTTSQVLNAEPEEDAVLVADLRLGTCGFVDAGMDIVGGLPKQNTIYKHRCNVLTITYNLTDSQVIKG